MSTPVPPTIIRGPAIVTRDSMSYYVQGDIKVSHKRTTDKTPSDMFGELGDTQASIITELSFTPVGEIKSLIKLFPYGPTSLVAASSVGNSIFTAADVPAIIKTKAGQTITYARTGISKMATMTLSPRKTLFGEMTITALGKRATAQTDAAYWKTIASASFADVSFAPDTVIKDIYTASLGARETPYDAIGARQGFEVELSIETENVEDDNVGIADILIASIAAQVKFAPNNLTEAQLDALLNLQDSDVLLPGQYIGRGPGGVAEDLTIDADALTAVLHNCGIMEAENGYGVKVDRNGSVTFVTRRTFTTGVPDPILSLTVN